MDSKLKTVNIPACLALVVTLAAAAVQAEGQAVILGNDADLGDFYDGENMTNFFQISNSSQEPVKIENVRPRCGCTVIQYTTNTLMPGKKSRVDYGFKTKGYSGPVSKSIMVLSGGTQQDFRFRLNVIKPVVLAENEQSSFNFALGQINAKSIIEHDVVVRVRKPAEDAAIMEINCNTNRWLFSYDPVPESGIMTVRLRLKKGVDFTPGSIRESVLIRARWNGNIYPLTATFTGEYLP